MNDTNHTAAQPLDLDAYQRVREEFELAVTLGHRFCIDSAMLNVDALIAQARAAQPAGAADITVSASIGDDHKFKELLLAVEVASPDRDDGQHMREHYDECRAALIAYIDSRATLAPVAAQQAAAEKHNAVECDSALRAEPAGQKDASVAANAIYRCPNGECQWEWEGPRQDPAPLCTHSDCARPMVEICPKNFGHPHDYSLRDDGLCAHCGHDEESELASRCRAEGGNTSDNEVSRAAAKAPAAQAVDALRDCLNALRTAWHISGVVQAREDIAAAIERADKALAASPASTPEASQQGAVVAAPSIEKRLEDAEKALATVNEVLSKALGFGPDNTLRELLWAVEGRLKQTAATAVAATTSEDAPSEKQAKLRALADRIDFEELWRGPAMDRHLLSDEQRDRLDAGVMLRRYGDLFGPGRWLLIPPTGSVQFGAGSLDKVYEMAKQEEERKAMRATQQEGGNG